MIVRCIDNLFQTGVLIRGREYEVLGEKDDCYILSGFDKGFSKTRFEIESSRLSEFIPTRNVVTPPEEAAPEVAQPYHPSGSPSPTF
jgi:hypothetical protein